MIDSGSCENIVSKEVVKKPKLGIEEHLKPYTLSWMSKEMQVTISKRCLVSLSIGSKYKDKVWGDVVAMNACHLLLDRPLQFDRDAIHDGQKKYLYVYE